MKKLIKSTLVAASVVVALAFAGCANETIEYVTVAPPAGANTSSLEAQLKEILATQETELSGLEVTDDNEPIDVAIQADAMISAINSSLSTIGQEMMDTPVLITLAEPFAKLAVEAADKAIQAEAQVVTPAVLAAAENDLEQAKKALEDAKAALPNDETANFERVGKAIEAGKYAKDAVEKLISHIKKDFSAEIELRIDGVISRDAIRTAYEKYYKGVGIDGKAGQVTTLTITGKATSIADGELLGGFDALTKITLPVTITTIGKNAFLGRTKLTTINLDKLESLAKIDDGAFKDCTALTKIDLPASVATIGEDAFMGCTALASVDLSKTNIKTISKQVFRDCIALTEITKFPTTLETIGYQAFFGCVALEKVELPASLKTIGQQAFYMCYKLETVTFDTSAKLATIEAAAFRFTVIKELDLPASLTKIGKEAFLSFPKDGVKFGNQTLNYNQDGKKLEKVTFQDTNGWKVSDGSGSVSVDVSNPVKNADNLRATKVGFSGYEWVKN